jgi:hypothetical protein
VHANREPAAAAAALEDKTLDVQAAGDEGVTFVITDQDV